ncbi:predicted protein [Histoplasma mississippiense (nom. inval.)]|uniref:predicted protein n=1 Tax=Ajellomyces capsulatus (strain NAm1 / WU24) TaxID=2059318 RepID=UPI000157C2F8|nr:predicted protein [Histoplasma mississippiense (nom. inval.)]EDN07895.1 predicted protein [Histoplasma mississippiense (nom. inval.)]
MADIIGIYHSLVGRQVVSYISQFNRQSIKYLADRKSMKNPRKENKRKDSGKKGDSEVRDVKK